MTTLSPKRPGKHKEYDKSTLSKGGKKLQPSVAVTENQSPSALRCDTPIDVPPMLD